MKHTALEDKYISVSILSLFVLLLAQYTIILNFNTSFEVIKWTKNILAGLVFVYSLKIILKKNLIFFLYTYSILIVIYVIQFVIYPQNYVPLVSNIFSLFFTCIPSFIYSYSIDNKNIFEEYTNKAANILFIIGSVLSILIFNGAIVLPDDYDMSFSYYLLLPATVFLKRLLDSFSLLKLFLFVFILLQILIFGARGPIFALIVYLFLYLIINLKFSTKNHNYEIFSFIMGLFILRIYMHDILDFLSDYLYAIGLKSRSIVLFLQGEVVSSGRDLIYNNVLNETIKNPFIGIGITGDRTLTGHYSHNILVEILSGFGIIAGSVIILIIILILVISLLKLSRNDSNFILLWITVGFVPLLLSSSYILSYEFWVLMGLSTKYIKNDITKKYREESDLCLF